MGVAKLSGGTSLALFLALSKTNPEGLCPHLLCHVLQHGLLLFVLMVRAVEIQETLLREDPLHLERYCGVHPVTAEQAAVLFLLGRKSSNFSFEMVVKEQVKKE